MLFSNGVLADGDAFPPRSAADIFAYNEGECFFGYIDWNCDDPTPGDNHSPSYRWGWQCAQRDRSADDDGFDGMRRAYLAERRAWMQRIQAREVSL